MEPSRLCAHLPSRLTPLALAYTPGRGGTLSLALGLTLTLTLTLTLALALRLALTLAVAHTLTFTLALALAHALTRTLTHARPRHCLASAARGLPSVASRAWAATRRPRRALRCYGRRSLSTSRV